MMDDTCTLSKFEDEESVDTAAVSFFSAFALRVPCNSEWIVSLRYWKDTFSYFCLDSREMNARIDYVCM